MLVGHTGGNKREGGCTESARAISVLDTLRSGEFPDIVVAGLFAIETSFDTITFVLDIGEREVDFRGNTSYIETSDIADTPSPFDGEIRTNTWLTVIISFDNSGGRTGGTEQQRKNGEK